MPVLLREALSMLSPGFLLAASAFFSLVFWVFARSALLICLPVLYRSSVASSPILFDDLILSLSF